MALLQQTVVNQYLKELDKQKLDELYDAFVAYYHNEDTQLNIKNLTEIQFQSEFLSKLFVGALGYTLNPSPDFNLTTEYKNQKDAKKADGAVTIGDMVPVVIELKDMKTTDLNQVENQAFGYKNNQPSCNYIVTSNFEKLRFYIDNAIEHIEFNLFTLTKDEFYLLHLCLSFESIASDIPKKIKKASVAQESKIGHILYKDYANFKSELYDNLTTNNPSIDPFVLYEKSQKLLDRFLFVFFAEDRGLLPANFIRYIINNWKKVIELDIEQSLYERFKINFNYLDKGHTNKDRTIFAYNGGLFAPDAILDGLIIDDALLHEHTKRLSDYDFNTEVDVNILGHIFENSLNDIEEVKSSLSGIAIDKKQTKRKKDGVFYTPKYITKYIVENTLGKLCANKKAELNITVLGNNEGGGKVVLDNPDYKYVKGRKKATVKALYDNLVEYQQWLLGLTICDPACGSGAFLNETLNFLIAEHGYINELELKLTGTSMPLPNIENSILEKNIFGVDINSESVDIAKLSLWLRTAKKNRKLNDLSSNLKSGNSLIDDPEVAGDKAFNWEKEFPQVFANGGFDLVIGNPPYGAKLDKSVQKWLNEKYIKGGSETAISFIKLGYENLLSSNGLLGYIIPKSFTYASNYKEIRKFVKNDISIIIDCKKAWQEVKLEQVIIIISNGSNTKTYQSGKSDDTDIFLSGKIPKQTFEEFGFYLNDISPDELAVGMKIRASKLYLNDISNNSRGAMLQKHLTEDKENMPVLGGAEIQREGVVGIKGHVSKKIIKGYSNSRIIDNSLLVQNIVAHITKPTDNIKITACFLEEKDFAIVDTINQISFAKTEHDARCFWLLLNSKLMNWYVYRFIFAKAIRTMHFDNAVTERIPIIEGLTQQSFIEKAEKMLTLNSDVQKLSNKFLRMLAREHAIDAPTRKLQKWYKLDEKSFFNELEKERKKIYNSQIGTANGYKKLSLIERDELAEYFLIQHQSINILLNEITNLKKNIDNSFYDLYQLNDTEIEIIESAYEQNN